MKELCPECLSLGKCLFDEYAQKVANELNSKKIINQDILILASLEVHQKIATERIEARRRMCPNLNNVDPEYAGKNLL